MKSSYAIIGGTGFYQPALLTNVQELNIKTPYGIVPLQLGDYQGERVVFLARHGRDHHLPPHRINYRANLAALKELEVTCILSTTAVGSLRQEIPRGMLVLVDQFIDLTKSRELTFFDGTGAEVVHTDFTEPYCAYLREHLGFVMNSMSVSFQEKGTYVCTEGPRYETPAEIKAYAAWGGDVVGMTNVPEVTLARELGICYATLSLVTNFAAGISAVPLTHREVVEEMQAKISLIRDIFMQAIVSFPANKACCCAHREDYKLGSS